MVLIFQLFNVDLLFLKDGSVLVGDCFLCVPIGFISDSWDTVNKENPAMEKDNMLSNFVHYCALFVHDYSI